VVNYVPCVTNRFCGQWGSPASAEIIVRLKVNAILYDKIEYLLLFMFTLIAGLQAKYFVDISIM